MAHARLLKRRCHGPNILLARNLASNLMQNLKAGRGNAVVICDQNTQGKPPLMLLQPLLSQSGGAGKGITNADSK